MLIERIKNKVGFFFRKKLLNLNVVSRGVKIGKDCTIAGAHISGNIEIGDNCKLNQVHISGQVKIGSNTSLWGPNITVTSEINGITIGNYTSIARGVTIQEFNHNIKRFSSYYINKNVLGISEPDVVSNGAISIGHDVWIGSNVIILSGVTIGTGAVIGANSVVSRNIPPYAIAMGSPAKVMKFRFSESVIEHLINSNWWDLNKEELKTRISDLDKLVEGL